jgi:hypothetical protein
LPGPGLSSGFLNLKKCLAAQTVVNLDVRLSQTLNVRNDEIFTTEIRKAINSSLERILSTVP